MNCEYNDCPHPAVCAARLNIPWNGFKNDDQQLSIVMGLAMCKACFLTLKPEDFLMMDHPKGMHVIFNWQRDQHRRGKLGMKLDFKRAYFTRVSFNSEEWMMLKRKPKDSGNDNGRS